MNVKTKNKVCLTGIAGKDPTSLRYLPSGIAATRVSLATYEFDPSAKNGANNTYTEWHQILFYDRLAELAVKAIKKGCYFEIEGKIRSRLFTAQDGTERTIYEIIASELYLHRAPNPNVPNSENSVNTENSPDTSKYDEWMAEYDRHSDVYLKNK